MTSSTAEKVAPLARAKPTPPIEEIMARALITAMVEQGCFRPAWDDLDAALRERWIVAVICMQREIQRLPDEQKRLFFNIEDRGEVKGAGKAIAELVRRHNQVDIAAQVMTFLGVSAAACEAAGLGVDLVGALKRAEASKGGL